MKIPFEIVTIPYEAECQNCSTIIQKDEPRLRYISPEQHRRGTVRVSKSCCIPCAKQLLEGKPDQPRCCKCGSYEVTPERPLYTDRPWDAESFAIVEIPCVCESCGHRFSEGGKVTLFRPDPEEEE